MEDAFITVVIVVSLAAAAVALFTLLASGRLWRQIGSGGIEPVAQAAAAVAAPGEREQEIQDMLDACNASRERRGEAPLEPDDELAALARPQVDHELARRDPRARRGAQPPPRAGGSTTAGCRCRDRASAARADLRG